ncbi:hypothetical protein [Oribacterium sp. P6A1]|uniref:hypothetical protein n=1 Tax=Oribacterium sp. P6A1 TaxID=1410612 RepID=UPI00056B2559|nr:hypothetical protein [Oribacterium sp. P6A1]
MDNINNAKAVKSDMPLYYGTAAVLLIVACVCIILIFQNIFSGTEEKNAAPSANTQVESVQSITETEEELKITHAGLPGSEEAKSKAKADDSNPVFRSKS